MNYLIILTFLDSVSLMLLLKLIVYFIIIKLNLVQSYVSLLISMISIISHNPILNFDVVFFLIVSYGLVAIVQPIQMAAAIVSSALHLICNLTITP